MPSAPNYVLTFALKAEIRMAMRAGVSVNAVVATLIQIIDALVTDPERRIALGLPAKEIQS